MTLIEALVSSVILGVGVAGLISAATLGMRNEKKSEQRTAAIYLAREKMAEVEMKGPHIWALGQPTSGVEERKNVTYDWTIQIDPFSAGELFDVAIKVDWFGSAGQGSVTLETWLNDYEAKVLALPGQENQPNTQAPTSGDQR